MNSPTPPVQPDFTQLVSQHYKDLTKSEKRIANYLRKNQDESSFLSAAEVADRLGISEATVVRFARTLGFPSYPAMRTHLQENFYQRVTHSTRLRTKLADLREAGDIFERLTVSEIDYLSQALTTVDRSALQQSVDLLKISQRIFVYGLGPSISLVDLMEIRLRRFGKDVIALRTSGREVFESLLSLNARDLVFIITFFDLNPSQQLILDYAREVNCPVIMLTDTLESVVSDKVNVVLAAKRGPISEFHSLVVPMTIINTLLLSLAGEEQEQVTANLDKLDQLRERLMQANRKFSATP
jgi:DNA-binding MurR/RpiR family transcriptional regulator